MRKSEKVTAVDFWRIYVDGVEVKANADEHKPEHEQQKGRASEFVLKICLVFNAEQCELPARR